MSYDFPGIFLTFIAIKLLIAYPYFAFCESSSWQATPGKLTLDTKVTDTDGQRISYSRATARYFLKSISFMLLMLGYVVSFSDRRQTWHDFMSGTLVLRRKVFPAYYAMPGVVSRWMFSLPKVLRSEKSAAVNDASVYECIACDHRGERHIGCPNCRRLGYVSVGVLRGLLLMNGLLLTLIGAALGYVGYLVISGRLLDDRLGREGTPWPMIFVIVTVCFLCLSAGVSSIVGKKWLLRLMLVTFVSGRRWQ